MQTTTEFITFDRFGHIPLIPLFFHIKKSNRGKSHQSTNHITDQLLQKEREQKEGQQELLKRNSLSHPDQGLLQHSGMVGCLELHCI